MTTRITKLYGRYLVITFFVRVFSTRVCMHEWENGVVCKLRRVWVWVWGAKI